MAPLRGAWRPSSLFVLLLVAFVAFAACNGKDSASGSGQTLTLGAYTTPREAYGTAVVPGFQKHWKAKGGKDLAVKSRTSAAALRREPSSVICVLFYMSTPTLWD